MTRQECERRIAEKLREILDIVNEYNPDEKRCVSMAVYPEYNSYYACRIIEHYSQDDTEPPVYDINLYRKVGEE